MEPENDNLSSGLSLAEYLAILRRRRAIILQAFILIAIVGVVVTLLTKPVYQSTAELLIDNPGLNVGNVDTSNPIANILAINQPQSASTVIEELQTPQLQEKVTQKVGPAALSFDQVKDTNVIQVSAEASDPRTAADACNEVMTEYIQQDADANTSSLETSRVFVEKQTVDAQIAEKRTEAALQAFRKSNRMVDYARTSAEELGRVAELQNALRAESINLAVLRARIAADQQQYAEQPNTTTYVLPVTNPRIAEMQAELRELRLQFESLTQPGGLNPNGDSPVLRALKARMKALQQQIAQQPALLDNKSSNPNTIRLGLRGSLTDAKASLQPLQTQIATTGAQLKQAQADTARLPDLEQKLEELTNAHDAAARQASMFSGQLSDLSLREQAQRPTAHVIQSALMDPSPVRPKKALNIAFACVIGLFVGLCLALLQEFLDDRINTTEDADRLLGLPSLGFVPTLTTGDARLLPQMGGATRASESYRVLRTNIHFAAIDNPLRTLLVSSAEVGAGKTTTAVNLAYAMVMDGKKVIIVDADLRRPSVHKLLGLPNSPGLTDVLAGDVKLIDALMQHTDIPGLMALASGTPPPNPSELLGSRAFTAVLEQLAEQTDVVIVDSPPVLVAADAQILASQIDGVIVVVEPGGTKKAAARQALSLLRHARANILGVAYNKIRTLDHESNYYYYQDTSPALNGDKKGQLAAPALSGAMETDKE